MERRREVSMDETEKERQWQFRVARTPRPLGSMKSNHVARLVGRSGSAAARRLKTDFEFGSVGKVFRVCGAGANAKRACVRSPITTQQK